jgi:mRNA interferase MazF
MAYEPKRGDLIWLDFTPQSGHEQAGRRPALVISADEYNRTVGLILACPVTSRVKGHPFEVLLPGDLTVGGVVLADQVRNLDWKSRHARFIAKAPGSVLSETLGKLNTLINADSD